MSAKIVFSDAPPEAIQTTTVSTTAAYYYAEPDILPRGANTGALATGELNSWGLSSDFKVWDKQKLGYWSESLSNDNCAFTTAPSIILKLGGTYTTSGLTIRFSPGNGEYCRKIFVEWFRGDDVVESGEFFPDTTVYAVERLVENFDKVKVTLKETNLPNRRAKLEMLGIGIVREYGGDCILDLNIDREVDLKALSLPISSADVTFQTPAPTDLYFFKRQIIDIYLGDEFEGRFFVENSHRDGESRYKISANDVISEADQYKTGPNYAGEAFDPVENHLNRTATDKTFEFELSDEVKSKQLNRGTPYNVTVREGIQNIAFAANAFVRTAGTTKILLSGLQYDSFKTIEAKDTYYGGTIEQADYITSVTLLSYEENTNRHDGDPYVIFGGGPAWYYVKYSDTEKNTSAESKRLKNAIEVGGCYYLNSVQARERTSDLFNYYMRRKTYKFKHIVRGEKVGDFVEATLPWGGTALGHIVKMKIYASALTVSDTEILLL